ncbi:MAG TPA: nucleotidyl transferase AbiEii/AbiGii toxin family protein [Candidatus Portnoybacteria bacterium]|nr:nucleotidyl transferase AbiEii/AbiGii toxin family protein [Candidatus Portnoybacteria bacterium]
MITKEQIEFLAKKEKIAESVIFREYLQLLFLQELYSQELSRKIFFKGGTALKLIYHSLRFSEDLDFTVEMDNKIFLNFIKKVFNKLTSRELVSFKEKKSIAGKSFLLTAEPSILTYKTFIKLDFSFREKVIEPQKSIIETDFPVIFTSYVYHLSKEEIFAEKIRALMTRSKERDLYDLWYLLTQGVSFKEKLVKEKLKYYHLVDIDKSKIIKKIESFSKKNFILDLRPFVSIDQRNKLGDFFEYLKDYLEKKLQ